MRQPYQEKRREPTMLVMQPELNEDHFEEGNYRRRVSRMEPQVVRRNNPYVNIEGDRCKYKDFIAAKSPSLSGSSEPVEVIDWIFEIECSLKPTTTATDRRSS